MAVSSRLILQKRSNCESADRRFDEKMQARDTRTGEEIVSSYLRTSHAPLENKKSIKEHEETDKNVTAGSPRGKRKKLTKNNTTAIHNSFFHVRRGNIIQDAAHPVVAKTPPLSYIGHALLNLPPDGDYEFTIPADTPTGSYAVQVARFQTGSPAGCSEPFHVSGTDAGVEQTGMAAVLGQDVDDGSGSESDIGSGDGPVEIVCFSAMGDAYHAVHYMYTLGCGISF